jgi:hypothetical protein
VVLEVITHYSLEDDNPEDDVWILLRIK